MATLKIDYPFKPFIITQKWGNKNPLYDQLGFSEHNGVDARPVLQPPFPKTYPVYCPVEGFTVQRVRWFPQGGGHEIWLISDEPVEMFERICHAYLVFCHADKILVPVGYKPKKGELIMIGDNTGLSTGIHTHMGLYRVNYDGAHITYLDVNNANNSFSPELFFTGKYAIDGASYGTLVTNSMRYYSWVVGL